MFATDDTQMKTVLPYGDICLQFEIYGLLEWLGPFMVLKMRRE